jgi:hypothetical protein
MLRALGIILLTISVFTSTGAREVAEDPTLLWSKFYGGIDNEEVNYLLPTSEQGCLVVGYTESFGYGEFGRPDIWLLELDSDGEPLWSETYGVADSLEQARHMIETTDGGYLAVGYKCEQYGFGGGDAILLKIDATGGEQWLRQYGGSEDDGLLFVQPAPDGGYIACGWTRSSGAGFVDAWVVKFDLDGNMEWDRPYGGSEYDIARTIFRHPDGGYLVTGFTNSRGAGSYDAWIFKLDEAGEMEWEKTHGGEGYDRAYFSTICDDGNFVLTGTRGVGAEEDLWIMKFDPQGEMIWEQTHDAAGNDEGHHIRQTTDGGFAVAAWASYNGNPWDQMWMLKLDPLGEIVWQDISGGPAADFGNVVLQVDARDYLLGGGTLSYGAGRVDMWVMKFRSETTTAAPVMGVITPGLTCYPNPFNPRITLALRVPRAGPVKLAIYDCSGRLVATPWQGEIEAGGHEIQFEAEDLTSGLYLVCLDGRGFSLSEKIVLLQ